MIETREKIALRVIVPVAVIACGIAALGIGAFVLWRSVVKMQPTSITTMTNVGCGATGSGVCRFVALNGSGSSSCSNDAPCTLQRAANIVNPGDVVTVRDGLYTVPPCAVGTGGKFASLNRGGTATDRVIFKAEHKWGAVLDGNNNCATEAFSFYTQGSYVTVRGFEIKGFSDTGFSNWGGGHHLEFIDNHIHDIGRYCTDTAQGRDGIFVKGSNVVIERNLIHDIGRFAQGENGCTPATTYYERLDHGVYISKANNVTVRNNIFYNNHRGWSIQVYNGAGVNIDNLTIVNNTFAFPSPYRDGHIIFADPVTNATVANNIFYRPRTAAINFYSGTLNNVVVNNNMIYQGVIKVGNPGGVTLSNNWDNTDPKLVNPAGFRFNLVSTSPAIDVGQALTEVTEDFDGMSRPFGATHDLGAYEYRNVGGGGGGGGGAPYVIPE